MKQLFDTYKTYIFIAAGILVAVVAWWSLSGNGSSNAIITAQDSSTVVAEEKGLVDTLLQLRAVTLSGNIFGDPAFATLQDFGTQIVPEPVGRPNPFIPFTVSSTSTAATPAQLFVPPRP